MPQVTISAFNQACAATQQVQADIAAALRVADVEPKFMTEVEAQMLRDLRTLKGRDEVTRKRLKAEVFALVKARLGIAQETKVKVEIDDITSPDYLLIKFKEVAAPSAPPPESPPARRQWYWVDATPDEAAQMLAAEFGVSGGPEDIDDSVGRGVAAVGQDVYVALTPEQADEYRNDD